MYKEPLTLVLQGINDEADPDDADADDADTPADTCSQVLVVDVGSLSLVSAEHSFIDNSELVSEIVGCVKCCTINQLVMNTMTTQINILMKVMSQRLHRLTSSLGIHVQCNWAFVFFRDNIYSFLQLLTLAGHVGSDIEAAKFGDCFLKSTIK